MKVLIVEDDAALGQFLEKGLRRDGHEVSWVRDGEEALERAVAQRPELMVLDLGLPRMDGIEVLEEMGERLRWTSVLVLTGRSDTEERVRCLNAGADDLVMKPFSFQELMARCRALLRRREQFADPVLRFEEIEMDRLGRLVTVAGRAVDLTATEFSLLESLMRRQGRCCSRAALLREVWQDRAGQDRAEPEADGCEAAEMRGPTNIVEVYINYLRKKLRTGYGMAAGGGATIVTVRGEGYRLGAAGAAGQIDLAEPGVRLRRLSHA